MHVVMALASITLCVQFLVVTLMGVVVAAFIAILPVLEKGSQLILMGSICWVCTEGMEVLLSYICVQVCQLSPNCVSYS